jgi:PEP-CTERM motif
MPGCGSLQASENEAVGELEPNGDVSQLRFTAVPEPATMTPMLSGLGAFAARRRYRGRR